MKTPLSAIPEDQKTPLVQLLLRIIQEQADEIALLKDEIAKLKGQKPRPKIPPSKVSTDAENKKKRSSSNDNSQALHARRHKRKEQRLIQPVYVPPGSRFKGYEDYLVQNLHLEATEI